MNRLERINELREKRRLALEKIPGDQGERGYQGETGESGYDGSDGLPGERGEKGEPGLPGTRGSRGLRGFPGEVGKEGAPGQKGIIWRANWTTGITYSPDEAVNSFGSSFICTVQHKSNKTNQPTIGEAWRLYWAVLAEKGDAGPGGSQGVQGEQGPQGNAGTDGQSSSLWKYLARTTATSGYPSNGRVLWNNATQTNATTILISHLTDDNLDIDVFLALMAIGQKLIIQDRNISGNYQAWTINSTPTIINPNTPTAYWNVPVTLLDSGGTGTTGFGNGQTIFLAITAGTSATSNDITNEVLTGTVNGINTVFTTTFNFSSGSTRVFINGIRQLIGVDYTETGVNEITFSSAPHTGDILVTDYSPQ